MDHIIGFFALLVFCNMAYAMPTWGNEEEKTDFSPSSVEITRRRCSCSDHHPSCGCCLQIRASEFQNYDEADVCLTSSFTPSPLAVDFFMMWNKREVFNRTISDYHPRPACFDIPRLNYGKACVKFTMINIKKDLTRGCAALEYKLGHNRIDIPLGCFFFRGGDGHGVDIGTYLDPASFIFSLEDIFQASKENQINSLSSLADLAFETWDVDKNGCYCSKSPQPHCECSFKWNIFGHELDAFAQATIDPDGGGFAIKGIINGVTYIDEHISVQNPPPICHDVTFYDVTVNVCFRLTQVSLKPGHVGACMEVDVDSMDFPLGCFYMATNRDLGIE